MEQKAGTGTPWNQDGITRIHQPRHRGPVRPRTTPGHRAAERNPAASL